ncbi:MAG: arsenosugar biosynthesis radical SAM protein ArsS [Syntrophobacterales bacterium]|nr:arsenosugar biosynthesis radical SAM protein ArsS [Syntrophobacterales bacterium]
MAVFEPFDRNLARCGLNLVRGKTLALQINVGYLCDLRCRHCHLEAGPERREVMTGETMNDLIDYASRVYFETIDITGGAPELVPGIRSFLARLAPLTRRLILRTNLVALREEAASGLMESCREMGVALVASFPSINSAQADALRGNGIWGKSLDVMRDLNQLGYGRPGSGLTLDLVVNPAGAFLPGNQDQAERRFKQSLERHGTLFNNLYSFANAPLGRYRTWLEQSGNLDHYFKTLFECFNPATIEGLMCRSLISVSWDGTLYDCDFNIAAGLPHGAAKVHVSSMTGFPEEGAVIATGDHCYACTAGAGFT